MQGNIFKRTVLISIKPIISVDYRGREERKLTQIIVSKVDLMQFNEL
jgi:hypothetical protein